MKSTVLSALITALNDVAPFDPFCAVALISCGMDESWPQSCTSAELSSSQVLLLICFLPRTSSFPLPFFSLSLFVEFGFLMSMSS